MNFSYSDEQLALRDLARQIFSDQVTAERLADVEAGPVGYDTELWSKLVEANLVGLAIPEALGGSGFGITEIGLMLEELGRTLAPVPMLPTLVLAGLPIAEFGSPEQQNRWLSAAATEGLVLSAALLEVGSFNPARPRTTAVRDGSDWRLDGVKECVPAAQHAGCILVPARIADDTVGVFLLDCASSGVEIEDQRATNRELQGRLTLAGAKASALGDPHRGAEIVDWIVERSLVALSAMQLGVCEEALRRTAEYVSSRKQFGRPIASFQAVQMRAADAYIDIDAMRSTLIEALWLLSEDRPAAVAVAVAKWWACTGGTRVTHTAQHLHGGIGSDLHYPIHRYFLWSKQLELTLGGASRQLARIGSLLVADAPG